MDELSKKLNLSEGELRWLDYIAENPCNVNPDELSRNLKSLEENGLILIINYNPHKIIGGIYFCQVTTAGIDYLDSCGKKLVYYKQSKRKELQPTQ